MDALFSSAFVIVIVDSIIPASEEQWGIDEAFAVFDHMIRRGVAQAVVYQEHLVEMNDFRWMLRKGQIGVSYRSFEPPVGDTILVDATSAPAFETSTILDEQNIINNHPDQDLIWSWMSAESGTLGMTHSDTIQSAITGLDLELMPTSLDFDANNQYVIFSPGPQLP